MNDASPLPTPRLAGFEWMPPQDELDEHIYQAVRSQGCSVLSVGSCATAPEFTYSVGLYLNFLHPEILLTGLHPDTARAVIEKLRDSAAAGGSAPDAAAIRCDLFEDQRPVRFLPVDQERYLDYLGRACSFYFPLFLQSMETDDDAADFHFPVLQAIWPGRDGRYPDEKDCDPHFAAIHRLVPQPE